jgi:hypothetical protein
MATCGYICPACDGKKILENGEDCSWCIPDIERIEDKKSLPESPIPTDSEEGQGL